MAEFDDNMLKQFLQIYYKRQFPFKLLHRWLNYGDLRLFGLREFAFIYDADVYTRWKSFDNRLELEKEVQSTCPEKIDIGAVYNAKPRDLRNKASSLSLEQKELVFDIDLSDYDDVRTCCSGGSVCNSCWTFVQIAMKVIDAALSDDFGFDHKLWVFSGRRGVHCWVADPKARHLSIVGRSAIVDYLTLISGDEGARVELDANTLSHPSVQRALRICRHSLPTLLQRQRWLDDQENHWQTRSECELNILSVKELLKNAFRKFSSPESRWRAIELTIESQELPTSCLNLLDTLTLKLCYPRLDVNVSKGLNHLLKCPFCVHPKTGNICVPIDLSALEDFSVDSVPRLDQLRGELLELDELRAAEECDEAVINRKTLDYKRTSLAPYVVTFERFINSLMTLQNES